jgi:hypothetical protein
MEESEKQKQEVEPIAKWRKSLLPHEFDLLNRGELQNCTHIGASSIWLEAPSSVPGPGQTVVYRPMGDVELGFLLKTGQLPNTQPYQAIIEGSEGREYASKYLTGQKWTDTNPTTVVEFLAPTELIETLKKMQVKVEDGALSMGLGSKAGGGLPLFNESLQSRATTYRIVKVKRNKKAKEKKRK